MTTSPVRVYKSGSYSNYSYSVKTKSFLSHIRNILSLPIISLTHQKRVIRWELPRLLSSIERLDILTKRNKSASLTPITHSTPRIQEARAKELHNEMENLVQSANRIKSLLGYKD